MTPSFLYLMAGRLIGMLFGCLRSQHTEDVEIAVLRHQLRVLRHQGQATPVPSRRPCGPGGAEPGASSCGWPGRILAGLPAHPGELRKLGMRYRHPHPHGAGWQRAWARAWTDVGYMASVSAGAGLGHRGHRLLTVETVRLTTLYLPFVIELGTRHPNGPWVVQRARELSMERSAGTSTPGFLMRDRDGKFTRAFDDAFASDGTKITDADPGAERRRVRRAVGADGTRGVS
jgi:hypothetical protein